MPNIFSSNFDADTTSAVPSGWSADASAWTAQTAPAGLSGKVAQAAQNTSTDQYLYRTFTRQTSNWLVLGFQFKTGSNVGTGYRWVDAKLYDGTTLALRFLHLDTRVALIDGNGTTLAVLRSDIAINTVYTVEVHLQINGASSKCWAIVNGTTYDNSGSYFTPSNTIAGVDTAKFSNFSTNSAGSQNLDVVTLDSSPNTATYTADAVVNTLISTNTKTCTADAIVTAPAPAIASTSVDKNARVTLTVTGAYGASSVKVYRSNNNSTWFDITSTYCTITSGGGGAYTAVDRRPSDGSGSAALGSTVYYKVTATGGGIESAASSVATTAPDVNVSAIETARFALLHSLISAQTGGYYPSVTNDVTDGEKYPGQWVLSMAYAYFKSGSSTYKTDAVNEFNYLVSLANGDNLLIWPGDTGNIERDWHFRQILFTAMAARLLRSAGDATTAATFIASADAWAKAAFDKLNSGSPTVPITRKGWDANNASGQTNNVAWAAGATIAAGAIRKPTTGNTRLYRARNAGTTGGSEPTWPTTSGGTVTDNGITWIETSATGAIFAATYANSPSYPISSSPTTGGTGQDFDVNQCVEIATAYALLLTDPASAFNSAGTYRTKANTVVQDTVNLLLAFQISGGKVPIGDPIPPGDGRAMYDTIYGGFTLSTASVINALYGGSVNPDLPLFVSGVLDWFDTLTGEPLAYTHYTGATAVSFPEVEFRAAGYRVSGRSNPVNNIWNTAAFNTATDRWGWYSEVGSPSLASPSVISDGAQARSLLGAAWVAFTQRNGAYSVDAVVLSAKTATYTTDAVVVSASAKAYTADAVVVLPGVKTYTADAVVLQRKTKTYTVDAVLRSSATTKIYTADAVLTALAPTPTYAQLDPPEVAIERTPLDLDVGPIRVDRAGVDWGDAAIQAYMADMMVGSAPVDYRLPNRFVTIPLGLGMDDSGHSGFDAVRQALNQKVALLQREGGWLKRASNVGPCYADIVNATLTVPDRYGQAGGVEPDVHLVLEALPDLYGNEIVLTSHVETSKPYLIFTESAITGEHPARVRILVSELQGNSQCGLLWGIRSRYYDPAVTAALAYEAESLTPLDSAAVATLAGSASGQVVTHSNLSTNWTPVLSTDMLSAGALTHRGSYHAWARVYTTSATPPSLRLLYDVGDLRLPEENDSWSIPAAGNFYIADLGEIRIDKAPVGTHRWRGVVQAMGAQGGENVSIDEVWLQPVGEGAGRLVALLDPDIGLSGYTARDEFNQTAGNLAGKTAPVGGPWASVGSTVGGTNASSATDFTVDATAHALTKTATDGARVATLPVSLTNVVAQTDITWSATGVGIIYPSTLWLGAVARFVDNSNFLTAYFSPAGGGYINIVKVVAGVATTIARRQVTLAAAAPHRLALMADTDGRVSVWIFLTTAPAGSPVLVAQDAALATGGSLAAGAVGILDGNTVVAFTRTYDNVGAWAPDPDAVLFASQSGELRTDGMFRYDTSGGIGPVTEVIGTLPRLPVSGPEGRTVEVFLKGTRGNFADMPDSGIDDIGAQIIYRPTYLNRA